MNVFYSYSANNDYIDGKVHKEPVSIRLLFHMWNYVFVHAISCW